MKPEGSLPYAEEPATGLYLKPDKVNPHSRIHLSIYFNIMQNIIEAIFFFQV
jgi:hypothetical protein